MFHATDLVANRIVSYSVMSVFVSVCLCVFLSAREHSQDISGTTRPIFTRLLCALTMSVAWSSSGEHAMCYVLLGPDLQNILRQSYD